MHVKKISFYLLVSVLFSCNQTENKTEISSTRKVVSKTPVASYLVPMGDPKLGRKFGVEVFETPQTFKFFLVMYNDGTTANDTLELPDLGINPVVKVKAGDEKLSCILGFADADSVFKEYKKLSIKNNQLVLTSLRRYYVQPSPSH